MSIQEATNISVSNVQTKKNTQAPKRGRKPGSKNKPKEPVITEGFKVKYREIKKKIDLIESLYPTFTGVTIPDTIKTVDALELFEEELDDIKTRFRFQASVDNLDTAFINILNTITIGTLATNNRVWKSQKLNIGMRRFNMLMKESYPEMKDDIIEVMKEFPILQSVTSGLSPKYNLLLTIGILAHTAFNPPSEEELEATKVPIPREFTGL